VLLCESHDLAQHLFLSAWGSAQNTHSQTLQTGGYLNITGSHVYYFYAAVLSVQNLSAVYLNRTLQLYVFYGCIYEIKIFGK